MVDNAPPTDGGIGQLNSPAPQQHPTLWQSIWWNPNAKQPPRLAEGAATSGKAGAVALRVLQWIVAGVAAMVLASVSSDYSRIHLPGASPELFWATVGMACACVLLHVPPVFFRLPRAGHIGAYALLVAFFFVAERETQVAVDAYAATPEGAQEARFNAELRRTEAAEQNGREEAARSLAASEKSAERQAGFTRKAEACLSGANHMPAFEEAVQNSLHNPASFQFVDITVGMARENEASLFMAFRGENGFGAIRTGSVKATVNTDDCTITNIEEPKVD